MSRREVAPASDRWPRALALPSSGVRLSEPCKPSSPTQITEEDNTTDEVTLHSDAALISNQLTTFPTDQVPQPVKRDTIAKTAKAALTELSGCCLPQSAPTVQAQISNTSTANQNNEKPQKTTNENHHQLEKAIDVLNNEMSCAKTLKLLACDSNREIQKTQAGSLVVNSMKEDSSNEYSKTVISSLSCQNIIPSCNNNNNIIKVNNNSKPNNLKIINDPNDLSINDFGNYNLNVKSNKMQSVNVNTISSTNDNINIYKGNLNTCLLNDSCNKAVTVPNTKPQRNNGSRKAENNNSFKYLDLDLNVNDIKHGALIRFNMEQPSQCRLNQIKSTSNNNYVNSTTDRDIPKNLTNDYDFSKPNKSDYLIKKDSNCTYNDNNISRLYYNNDDMAFNHVNNLKNTDDYICFDKLIALTKRTNLMIKNGQVPKKLLGLFGGGESSLSTGTTGWGTPPGTNSNNNNGWGNSTNQTNGNNPQWNNNQNRTNSNNQGPQNVQDNNSNKPNNQNSNMSQQNSQMQPQTSQANNQGWGPQNKGPGPGAAGPNNGPQPPASGAPSQNNQAPPANSTKQQLEQLNNMREALFATDGWGGQHVNQDTNWDIPSSPEPQIKIEGGGPQQWKPAVNNGTDLWEVNLRNGGQPPPQPQQKAPWGHTPSTNIGGTWGEDDDVTDSSNVWTGVPNNQQQWTGNNSANASQGMWGNQQKKESEWGGTGWGDPRDPRQPGAGMDPREMRMDPRDMRANTTDPMRMLDPREMRMVNNDMRGDPRGITGRINSANNEMWNGVPPQGPHHLHQPGKLVGPGGNNAGVNQWGGPPPKDMAMPGKPTGWEELSPPSQRRMPNYDDGTSLWGNPANQASGGNMSHWKELPTGPSGSMARQGGASMGCPPGMAQSRIKPDGSVWGARNGSWEEGGAHTGWDETAAAGKWPDGGASWAKTKGGIGGNPLWESDMDWGHKQGPKPLTKDAIWNSKQFRMLVELGYKKEDAENALRARDMIFDEALDLLNIQRSNSIGDGWRNRHDEHFDHQNSGPFPGQRFSQMSGPTGQMPFPPSGNPSLLNSINSANTATNNPQLTSINNVSPALVHKMLNQTQSSPAFNSGAAGRSLQPQSQPSTQQLRMLVQQIQMAVQAGYLNHQILNQPLAPQTLILLNQLLQQIKQLQQLTTQQTMAQQGSVDKRNSSVILQCSVLITKTKQQIQNLQNQIAAQQAIYVKQQQQQHIGAGGGSAATPADFFKANIHDSINALQSNFSDLGISKDSQSYNQNQQSRLNQWKLPSLEKENEPGGEFSRAPGSVSKPLAPSHSSPNLNPLGLNQADGLWSNGRSTESGWPDPNPGGDPVRPPDANKDWPTNQASLTDLVPEFEPGKPWKGNQIKSIEDDPSITPGSVVRSPLSLATIKDTDIFTSSAAPSKPSPTGVVSTDLPPLSLSSSTWSFPSSTAPSAYTSPLSKVASSKGAWGDSAPAPTAVTSELWGAPMNKSRGPPPGLVKGSSNMSANGWNNANSGVGRVGASWSSQTGSNWSNSSWLLLRNLTAQIDGSTLRTLCLQHGPLQSFHLYLHQGIALIKYSTREEATKAQQALNNCVLGNTTILAESPGDSEVNLLLQQIAPQQGASTGTWRSSNKPSSTADTWNTVWPSNPSSGSLWGAAPMDNTDPARATPSSLNSFLPGDLLGGESM